MSDYLKRLEIGIRNADKAGRREDVIKLGKAYRAEKARLRALYQEPAKAPEPESWGETIGGGLSTFGSGLTFGLSDYIPGAKEARQKFAKNHNILAPVLEVGGMVAPMLIPGGALVKGGLLATKGAEALSTGAKFASGAGKAAGVLGAKGLTNATNAVLKKIGKEALIHSPKFGHRLVIGTAEGGVGGAFYGFNTADGGLNLDGLKNRLKGSASGATFGALGGAAAPLISNGLSGIIKSPFTLRLNKNQKLANFANILKKEGIDLTAGQRLNSDFLQKVENKFGTFHAGKALNNQQNQFTRAALRKAGIEAMEASPDVLNAAKEKFSDVASRNRKYENFKIIQKAVDGTSPEAASGIITPSSLIEAAKNSAGTHNWTIGNSDFSDLARAGQVIFNSKPRASWLGDNILKGSGMLGAGSALYFHSPTVAASGLAPIGAALGLTTKPIQKYLTNSLFNDSVKRNIDSFLRSIAVTQGNKLIGR